MQNKGNFYLETGDAEFIYNFSFHPARYILSETAVTQSHAWVVKIDQGEKQATRNVGFSTRRVARTRVTFNCDTSGGMTMSRKVANYQDGLADRNRGSGSHRRGYPILDWAVQMDTDVSTHQDVWTGL